MATCLIVSLALGAVVQHDWTADGDWASWGFTGFMTVGLLGGAVWLSFHIWRRPTPKMDRVVLLICMGWITASLMRLGLVKLMPDAWEAAIDWVALVLLPVWHAMAYRSVEEKWVTEGRLHPLPEGKPWPVMRKTWFGFIVLMSVWGIVFTEMGVTDYEGEGVFGSLFWSVFMPALLTWGMLRLGRYGWRK
jgi:hypothetical protein